MSGVISNDDEHGWKVAGWGFQGYLGHVLAEVRYDRALVDTVQTAIACHGLHLDHIDHVTLERLRPVLLRIADAVISGVRHVQVDGRTLDAGRQDQFRRAVGELRELFTQWW